MRKLLALLPLLFVAACAYTKVESQKLPAASAEQPFQALFVFNAGMELGQVREIEKTMAEELTLMGVNAQFGLAHLPFDAGPDAVFAKARELAIDGLLIVKLDNFDIETQYTPGYYVAATKKTPGYYVPATTTQIAKGKFSAELHSMRNKEKPERVWIAQVDSSSSLGGAREVFQDVGRKIPRKLVADGLLIDARPKK